MARNIVQTISRYGRTHSHHYLAWQRPRLTANFNASIIAQSEIRGIFQKRRSPASGLNVLIIAGDMLACKRVSGHDSACERPGRKAPGFPLQRPARGMGRRLREPGQSAGDAPRRNLGPMPLVTRGRLYRPGSSRGQQARLHLGGVDPGSSDRCHTLSILDGRSAGVCDQQRAESPLVRQPCQGGGARAGGGGGGVSPGPCGFSARLMARFMSSVRAKSKSLSGFRYRVHTTWCNGRPASVVMTRRRGMIFRGQLATKAIPTSSCNPGIDRIARICSGGLSPGPTASARSRERRNRIRQGDDGLQAIPIASA